jgi:hypothetical protein
MKVNSDLRLVGGAHVELDRAEDRIPPYSINCRTRGDLSVHPLSTNDRATVTRDFFRVVFEIELIIVGQLK